MTSRLLSRRVLGWLRLLAAVALVAGVLLWTGPSAEGQPRPREDRSPADRLYEGTDPTRHLEVYKPTPLEVVLHPQRLRGRVYRRAIRVEPHSIELVRGSTVLRHVAFDATHPVGFAAVVGAIDDHSWVKKTNPGTYLLRSAFVQAPDTTVAFGPPRVRIVRLSARPHVFLGGVDADVRFRGVHVTSWNEKTKRPDTFLSDGRPFMSYANGSRVDIARSEIGYLGFDATTAYGLSWRSGSTGSVVDSDVHHNFFGLYSYEAVDLEVRNNVFRNNVFYGIDPHDYSSGLTISSNETYGNGSHGIIFSQGVVNSVVRDNYSHDNGSNGIVMDDESNENVVAHNVVEHNEGDGIVILGSSRVLVRDNDVRDNRVGVRVNYVSGDNVIRGNRIEGNVRGVEVYGGARETQLSANRIARSSSSGMILEAPASRSIGDVVTGSPVGIEVRSLAEIRQTQIRDVDRGIVVTPRGIVDMRRLQVQATDIGLELAPTALGRLDYSSVEAAEPVSGKLRYAIRNDLITPLPVPWLAIAGAGFLSAAVALELMHWARNKVLLSSVAISPAFKSGR